MDTVVADRRNPALVDWAGRLRRWLGASSVRNTHFSKADRAVIAAQGKALTLLVTMLHTRGAIDIEDFAGTLAVFSVVVAEDNQPEGDILAVWAGVMKDSL